MSRKPEKKKKEIIRLLVWGDSPAAATGFATVIRNIFTPLAFSDRYDIDILGINDRGGFKDPRKHPYRIYPARSSTQVRSDYHGRDRLVAAPLNKDADLVPPWDIIFTLNDPFILNEALAPIGKGAMEILKKSQETLRKKLKPEWHFKIVSYWPIDSSLRGNWVGDVIDLSDYPVAYTEYAKEEIKFANEMLSKPTGVMKKLRVIYHGVNLKNFCPLKQKEVKKFRDNYFEGKVRDDTFLLVAVARNQLRKDLPRTMQIFKEFKKRRPDSFLYLHCQETDAWGSLNEYARNWDLKLGEDWGVPSNFSANTGFPLEFMNLLYNAADVIISTSLGEGFGFYNLEGFATKTPVVAPNNTTHPELFNYDKDEDISDVDKIYTKLRGIPIACSTTSSEWATYGPTDFERIRPLTNVEDGLKKLLWVYDNPDKVQKIVERAYNWVQDYGWDKIWPQWDQLFQEVYKDLKHERSKVKFTPRKKAKAKPSKRK